MSAKVVLLGTGVGAIGVGAMLLVRFWKISGTETPPGQSGGETVNGLDWASFFASPLLILAGAVLVVFGLVRKSRSEASGA